MAQVSGQTVFETTKPRPYDSRKRVRNMDASDVDGYTGPWGGYVDEEKVSVPDEVRFFCCCESRLLGYRPVFMCLLLCYVLFTRVSSEAKGIKTLNGFSRKIIRFSDKQCETKKNDRTSDRNPGTDGAR